MARKQYYFTFRKKNISYKTLNEIFTFYTNIDVYYVPYHKKDDYVKYNYVIIGRFDTHDYMKNFMKYSFMKEGERQYIIYDELDKKIWR